MMSELPRPHRRHGSLVNDAKGAKCLIRDRVGTYAGAKVVQDPRTKVYFSLMEV